MKKLIIILFILFSTGCINQDIKPNFNIYPSHELLTQAVKNVYRVYAVATIKSDINGEDWQNGRVGTAFAIDRWRLLTVNHLLDVDKCTTCTPFGTVTVVISSEKIIKKEIWLLLNDGSRIPAKVVYKNSELDFAVLKTESKIPFPTYSVGDSDNLRMLDRVFIVSNVGYGKCVKPGYVMQLDFIEYIETGEIDKRDSNKFGLCLAIKMGDSGAPVLLARNGKLEVVGIVSSGDSQGTGYGIKINSIMDRFKTWQNEREW